MRRAGNTKNDYQHYLHVYLKRREEYKNKYGVNSKRYLDLSRGMDRKLYSWRRAIKRIETRNRIIEKLAVQVIEYLSIDKLQNTAGTRDKKVLLGQKLFYKLGLESGLYGTYLSLYTGHKKTRRASLVRMGFTRSFPFNKQNKEVWYHFNQYINNKNCVGGKIAVAA